MAKNLTTSQIDRQNILNNGLALPRIQEALEIKLITTMKEYPFLWLLVYTKTGRVILGLMAAYIFIRLAEWWAIPITTGSIGYFLLEEYYKEKTRAKKKWMKIGICLLGVALLSSLIIMFYPDIRRLMYRWL